MTEKIIIDGVNVSECKYYHYKGCSATGLRCENCTCYYKQLKRLEEKYNKMVEISKENLIKYEDLRLDNQKLNLIIDRLLKNSGYPDTVCSAEDFETVYENMQIKQVQLNEYKQALEEIREIATDLKQTKIPYCQIEEQIQEIITEAIGGKQCQQ